MTALLIVVCIAAAAGLALDHHRTEIARREALRRHARLGRLWRGTYDLVDETPVRVRQ